MSTSYLPFRSCQCLRAQPGLCLRDQRGVRCNLLHDVSGGLGVRVQVPTRAQCPLATGVWVLSAQPIVGGRT
eukprot:scaffold72670_cov30-Tisochrysis_lutea.AAC.3